MGGLIPEETASFTVSILFQNGKDDNATTITTTEPLNITPEMGVRNQVLMNYTTATITPNVENPLYAESIRGDVYNSNTGDLLVSLYSVPVDGVVSPFTFNGNAGGYSIETTVQYAGGDENATASDTTSFTLRNRPVTPPPSTGGGTDNGGSTGGGGGGRA